jgi:hypothetical protein
LVTLADSGHDIKVEHLDEVIDAIRQVVAAVRGPSTWATDAATPPA